MWELQLSVHQDGNMFLGHEAHNKKPQLCYECTKLHTWDNNMVWVQIEVENMA